MLIDHKAVMSMARGASEIIFQEISYDDSARNEGRLSPFAAAAAARPKRSLSEVAKARPEGLHIAVGDA